MEGSDENNMRNGRPAVYGHGGGWFTDAIDRTPVRNREPSLDPDQDLMQELGPCMACHYIPCTCPGSPSPMADAMDLRCQESLTDLWSSPEQAPGLWNAPAPIDEELAFISRLSPLEQLKIITAYGGYLRSIIDGNKAI